MDAETFLYSARSIVNILILFAISFSLYALLIRLGTITITFFGYAPIISLFISIALITWVIVGSVFSFFWSYFSTVLATYKVTLVAILVVEFT